MSLESVLSMYMNPDAAVQMAETIRARAKKDVADMMAKVPEPAEPPAEPAYRIQMRALGYNRLTSIDLMTRRLRAQHSLGIFGSVKDLLDSDSE
jgi:hypothetical protein